MKRRPNDYDDIDTLKEPSFGCGSHLVTELSYTSRTESAYPISPLLDRMGVDLLGAHVSMALGLLYGTKIAPSCQQQDPDLCLRQHSCESWSLQQQNAHRRETIVSRSLPTLSGCSAGDNVSEYKREW